MFFKNFVITIINYYYCFQMCALVCIYIFIDVIYFTYKLFTKALLIYNMKEYNSISKFPLSCRIISYHLLDCLSIVSLIVKVLPLLLKN